MDFDFDTNETLIRWIESKPILYDMNHPDYLNQTVKEDVWTELCQVINPDWDKLSATDQTITKKDVRTRWQNLRTCFTREIKIQKSGKGKKRRRQYIYYEQMSFLKPYLKADKVEDDESVVPKKKKKKLKKSSSFCDSSSYEAIDEDRTFVLSLVPSLKRLDADKKLLFSKYHIKLGVLINKS